jgi:hypothetical protein
MLCVRLSTESGHEKYVSDFTDQELLETYHAVAEHLDSKELTQKDAEELLDLLTQELDKRVK